MGILRPNQMSRVTGMRNLGFDQTAALRKKQQYLPTILEAEQRARQHEDTMKLERDRLAQEQSQAQKEMKFKRDESRKNLGLSIAKFGTTALNSDFLKGMTGKLGTWKPGDKPTVAASKSAPIQTGQEVSKFGTFNTGGGLTGALGGGAMGFGLGQMFGKGKAKWLGAGLGALAGGLLGGGLNIGSALSGGSFFTGGI